MNVRPVKTRVFLAEENLIDFISAHISSLSERSIIVVTSKIIALSEGRTAFLADAEKIIAEESTWSKQTRYGKLTLKDGILMWNAGIDESNASGPPRADARVEAGKIVLLPRDSFKSAEQIRSTMLQKCNIKQCGVIITDSRIMPLRSGVVGIALGYAGFKGLRDYRGAPDIFGRPLKYTQTDVADSLATAAVCVMGEGSETQPLCLIEDAPVEYVDTVDRNELLIPLADDMYRPLFGDL